MEQFVGLDISVRETSLCMVTEDGQMVAEKKESSEPEAIISPLADHKFQIRRIGLDAGPLSQ